MSVESEKLYRFENAIFSNIEHEINSIVDAAQSEKDEIVQKAKEKYLYNASKEIRRTVKKLQGKTVKLISQEEIKAKGEVLKHREKLVDQLFDTIVDRINAFTVSDKYANFLSNAATDAVKEIDGVNATILIRQEDIKHKDAIQKAVGANYEIKVDSSINLGGLSILLEEGKVLIDRTLDSAIDEQRKRFVYESGLGIN